MGPKGNFEVGSKANATIYLTFASLSATSVTSHLKKKILVQDQGGGEI